MAKLSTSPKAVHERQFRLEHPGKSAEYSKRYRQKHPGRQAQNSKRHYLAHPLSSAERRLKFHREHPDRAGFTLLKDGAKTHGRQCTITFEEYQVLRAQLCFYCGGSLPEHGHGVDRINSQVGYVTGNVRPCCTQCNLAKGPWSETVFREWSLRLYNHWSGK